MCKACRICVCCYHWPMEQLGRTPFEADECIESEILWEGTRISIKHNPRWLYKDGDDLIVQHIEICSHDRERLPITETGYRSHFLYGADALSEFSDDAKAYVAAWLTEAAQTKDWQEHCDAQRQLSLF